MAVYRYTSLRESMAIFGISVFTELYRYFDEGGVFNLAIYKRCIIYTVYYDNYQSVRTKRWSHRSIYDTVL